MAVEESVKRVELFTHIVDGRHIKRADDAPLPFGCLDTEDGLAEWLEDRSITVDTDCLEDYAAAQRYWRYRAWMDDQAWTEYQLTWK